MNCFCARTRLLARLLTRHYTEHLKLAGVTPTQFELLGRLSATETAGQSEIVKTMDLDQTTLSRNMKSMIENGWVRRTAGRKDSRVALYSITPAGKTKLKRAYPEWKRAQSAIERALGSEARAVWAMFERLKGVLETEESSGR